MNAVDWLLVAMMVLLILLPATVLFQEWEWSSTCHGLNGRYVPSGYYVSCGGVTYSGGRKIGTSSCITPEAVYYGGYPWRTKEEICGG